jgi:hypothetical protein
MRGMLGDGTNNAVAVKPERSRTGPSLSEHQSLSHGGGDGVGAVGGAELH